jgi:PIN domain nuclease of toxin-antitoxin system
MRILVDTHVLIWALSEPTRLGEQTRRDLSDSRNVILFSAASIWEIAIKAALRRSDFMVDADEMIDEAISLGFQELSISSRVAARVKDMPMVHQDPFDRILLAQAMAEPAILLTADSKLQPYSDLVRLI